jgi:hypothetical protein
MICTAEYSFVKPLLEFFDTYMLTVNEQEGLHVCALCLHQRGSTSGRHPMNKTLAGAVVAAVLGATTVIAPPANATPIGNFDLVIPDRFDFHTWAWSVTPCINGAAPPPQCIHVFGIARPNAKAFNYEGDAQLADGSYTLTVDDPFGLRCGNVYYGPTSTTHDVYVWNGTTMAGTLTSTFGAGCDGASGTLTYPISLARL